MAHRTTPDYAPDPDTVQSELVHEYRTQLLNLAYKEGIGWDSTGFQFYDKAPSWNRGTTYQEAIMREIFAVGANQISS